MAYAALFCVAVAMVLRGIPYWLGLIVIVAALLVLDRRALLGVDWGLLVIFAAFFTFSGNMARIEPVRELFRKLLAHGVMPVASLASLITFREYTKHVKGQTGRFMALFSVISFGFLPAECAIRCAQAPGSIRAFS